MTEFLTPIIKDFVDVLYPLRKGLSSAEDFELLLVKYGWDSQINSGNMNAVNAAFAVEPLVISVLEKLDVFVNGSNQDQVIASTELILSVKNTITKISNLSSSSSGLPAPLDQSQFWSEVSTDLLSDLLANYFEKRQPVIFSILHFTEIISYENKNPIGASRISYIQTKIDFGKLGDFFTSPFDLFKETYHWGVPNDDFNHLKLLKVLERILLAFKLPAMVNLPRESIANKLLDLDQIGIQNIRELYFPLVDGVSPSENAYWRIGLVMIPIPDPIKSNGKVVGIALVPQLQGELTSSIYFSKDIYLKLTGAFDAGHDFIIQIFPDKTFLDTSLSETAVKAAFELIGDPVEPWVLLGSSNTSRIELGGFLIKLVIAGKISNPEIIFSIGTGSADSNRNPKLSFVFDPSESDGFVTNILGENGFNVDFQTNLVWSSMRGVSFEGQASFEIQLPIHQALGPIEITTLYLAMGGGNDGGQPNAKADFGIGVKGELGPLSFVVENIGASLNLIPINSLSQKGILGSHDLVFGFKPPNGVGLSIDTDVVKGGGYLYFNYDKEEYAGALELTIKDLFSLKAVGLITTRMPDGSPGFSLLIIITAEFGSPIQLGYGFTLSGVGGLLGLNRTMLLEPLAEGVRTGAINSVMFPTNVVENAPRIISDLKAFFPPAEGIFLIGPMAKIGWGTPNVITLSLGIIIEIPGNIAILGILKVVLKNEEAEAPAGSESEMEVLVLQVKFIGAIEFDKKRGWFFASLFESRILFMTIDGEMGLLVAWGDNPNFVISVGGFHPAFKAPPLPFPEPRRISMSILNTDYARIRVDGYFAITPNTIQFGASVDLFFGFDAFKLDGQFAFDALFRAPPLYFIITVSTSISVKVFGVGFFSVHFRGSLEGPTPWHIEGTGTVTLLFFDIPIDFSETWGEEVDTILLPIQVLQLVEKEFNKLENWKTTLPAQTRLFVSLRKIETTSDLLVLHPVGTLQISQRAVPLELQLDKVGDQKPEDVNYLSVAVNAPGLLKKADLNESFAMAQFKNMDDSKKLSSPSFEKWKAGLELAAATAQANASLAIKRVVRYEKIIIDTNYKRFIKPLFVWFSNLFSLFLNGNTVVKSTASQHFLKQKQPFTDKVVIQDEVWVVASSTDNSPLHTEAGSFSCQAKAYEYLQQQIAVNPKLADNIHVIPQTEIRRAA